MFKLKVCSPRCILACGDWTKLGDRAKIELLHGSAKLALNVEARSGGQLS